MGRTGETCGAVTGAVMVISLRHSAKDRAGCPGGEQASSLTSQFIREFRRRNRYVLCRELLGADIGEGAEQNSHLFKHCPRFVQDAAEIMEEMIRKSGAKGSRGRGVE